MHKWLILNTSVIREMYFPPSKDSYKQRQTTQCIDEFVKKLELSYIGENVNGTTIFEKRSHSSSKC
jgi:hypothetical protein